MNPLDRLVVAHPQIFRGAHPIVPSHLPEGWYGLVDELCCGIESILGPKGCAELEVTQIKEKFGGLRFYFALSGKKDMYMDVHMARGVKTLVEFAQPSVPEMVAIRELIAQAAKASKATCQACGAQARIGKHDGWLTSLCEKHHADRSTEQQAGGVS